MLLKHTDWRHWPLSRKSVSVFDHPLVKNTSKPCLNFPWRQNMLINYFCPGYNGKHLYSISSVYYSIYSQQHIEKHMLFPFPLFVWEKAALCVEGLNWASPSCTVAICGCFPLQTDSPAVSLWRYKSWVSVKLYSVGCLDSSFIFDQMWSQVWQGYVHVLPGRLVVWGFWVIFLTPSCLSSKFLSLI